ncbi:MAG: energy transducer TonB [Candidatus Latescibacteria bacterium]|nr:energy transducer TonB [Candidatus Latescibacterota bacterium]
MASAFSISAHRSRPGHLREHIRYPVPSAPPWIVPTVVRFKYPDADLKRHYPKIFGVSVVLSSILLALICILFPAFEFRSYPSYATPVIISLEDIPETYQAPMPESEDMILGAGEPDGVAVVDTVEDEASGIDFLANLQIDDTLGGMDRSLDEEAVEFWAVSKEPVLVREVLPVYPRDAHELGLEGVVFVKFAVGTDGRVKEASIQKGPGIFHASALEAVYRFAFRPALQNDKPVAVWMTRPIRFRIVDNLLEARPVQPVRKVPAPVSRQVNSYDRD